MSSLKNAVTLSALLLLVGAPALADGLVTVIDRTGPCPRGESPSFTAAAGTVEVPAPSASNGPLHQPPVRTFRRADKASGGPWTLELCAAFKRAALAGNALFILYDADDPKAVAEHEVSALYQAPIHAGKALADGVSRILFLRFSISFYRFFGGMPQGRPRRPERHDRERPGHLHQRRAAQRHRRDRQRLHAAAAVHRDRPRARR
jgi:hypothetical protein